MRFRATYTYKSLGWYDGEEDWRTEVENVDCEAGTWPEAYSAAEEAIERELGDTIGGLSPVPYTVLALELMA